MQFDLKEPFNFDALKINNQNILNNSDDLRPPPTGKQSPAIINTERILTLFHVSYVQFHNFRMCAAIFMARRRNVRFERVA